MSKEDGIKLAPKKLSKEKTKIFQLNSREITKNIQSIVLIQEEAIILAVRILDLIHGALQMVLIDQHIYLDMIDLDMQNIRVIIEDQGVVLKDMIVSLIVLLAPHAILLQIVAQNTLHTAITLREEVNMKKTKMKGI